MEAYYGRHFVTTERDLGLPLHLSTVGYSEHQGPINREEGFPIFHWLHTIDGCGEFTVNGRTDKLAPGQGILLKPHVPHSYSAITERWSVWFMTFDGALANPITASLELQHMRPIGWESDAPLSDIHRQIGDKVHHSYDLAGMNGSLEVYALLTQLKQYGKISGQTSLSKGHERLAPIYKLIEERYADPGLGLTELAETLDISSQRLSALFRSSWGISPYQYLLQFRIGRAKEMLIEKRNRSVKDVAGAVGFLDDSHFVHTFRRLSGMTPAQFRRQYGE